MKTIQILKVLLGLSSVSVVFSELDILVVDEFNISETREGDPELLLGVGTGAAMA